MTSKNVAAVLKKVLDLQVETIPMPEKPGPNGLFISEILQNN